MKEATRYVVLFMSVIFSDVISILSGYILWSNTRNNYFCGSAELMIAEVVFAAAGITFIQSIYLSFVFNHEKYEKWYQCGYCDQCVQRICEGMVKKRHRKIISKQCIEIPLLSNFQNGQ